MSDSSPPDKATAVRAPASPPHAYSPIVQLLPTGYRDIQPFQRGQGWHSNGKATSKLRRPRGSGGGSGSAASERVVFPILPGQQAVPALVKPVHGPKVSAVDGYDPAPVDAPREEDDVPWERDGDSKARSVSSRDDARGHRVLSPSTVAIPVPPSGPRRPSLDGKTGDGNQRTASGGSSFRTRALTSSAQNNCIESTSTTATLVSAAIAAPNVLAGPSDEDAPPDPAVMEKLWQEYAERTKHSTKTVDRDTYHRKMHHRYNDLKALRERVARLESELDDTRRERDEAQESNKRSIQQSVLNTWKDGEDPASGDSSVNAPTEAIGGPSAVPRANGERTGSFALRTRRSMASLAAKESGSAALKNPEEVSYREKCFKVERALATAKESIARQQERLLAMHDSDRSTIETLRAQLQLEQEASKALSRQLRETNAAFRATADELVTTQVTLEKEQTEKQIALEQIQAETRQLISDHKRKELQSRVKSVVRTLGKEALHQKMEALHTRVLMAEHHMRAAQLEVGRLRLERERQQQELDEILASRAIKYHSLASRDGGVPGILARATTLYHGTRTVDDQYLLVHMLYEDSRAPGDGAIASTNQDEQPGELEDGFCVHVLVYEAFTAQDDYLTFHLRDIQRLVPDAAKFLARYTDRRHERYLELAELLFAECHIGYKNGHIVLTEKPRTYSDIASTDRTQVTIYRGTQYVAMHKTEHDDEPTKTLRPDERSVLVDLVVNEVYKSSTSQLWWLEVHASPLDNNLSGEAQITIDSVQLKEIVGTFASYRPSDSLVRAGGAASAHVDEEELYGIHEELLSPLLARLELRVSPEAPASSALVLLNEDGSVVTHANGSTAPVTIGGTVDEGNAVNEDEPVQGKATSNQLRSAEANVSVDPIARSDTSAQVLDHRSIVGIEDRFFCLRIQELWDGELMVRVTMEEPDDAQRRYQVVLSEMHVVAIASYLHRSGVCAEDYAATIKYGLPALLHAPLCKLLKKHLSPVDPDPAQQLASTPSGGAAPRSHNHSDLRQPSISIASLLDEMRLVNQAASPEEVIVTVSLPEPIQLFGRTIEQVGVFSAAEIALPCLVDVLAQLRSNRDELAGATRSGCRYLQRCAFAVVTCYPALLSAPDLVVIDVAPIGVSADNKPVLVIARGVSVTQTLVAIGLRVPLGG